MGPSERSLIELGRRVAELQDGAPEARLDRAGGRARLLGAEAPAAPRPARRPVLRALAPAAAALAIAAAIALWLRPGEPLRFETGAGEPGATGAWIAAPASEPLPIRFSDGSVLELAPAGRARVAAVGPRGAEIALERGSLDLAVVHRDGTSWQVRVGPFRIDVVGTRFETRWDPMNEELDVALHEGAITVSGPVVGDLRRVRAGEELRVSIPRSTLEVTSAVRAVAQPASAAPEAAAAESAALEPAAPAPIASAVVSAPSGAAGAPLAATAPSRPRASWRALARDARYKEALAAAEADGFGTLCATADAGDLRALADTARLGGAPLRANEALTALRSRFPGTPEAAGAAFLLGRMAEERRSDHGAAVAWFRRYLAEAPHGELAEDARGRIVEATDQMGDAAAARDAAEVYLALYPRGAHAAYASAVLSRAPDAAP